MSIQSTLCLTRETALAYIASQTLDHISNEQLEDILESLINNRFHNFSIVSEIEDEWNSITSLNDFPNTDV